MNYMQVFDFKVFILTFTAPLPFLRFGRAVHARAEHVALAWPPSLPVHRWLPGGRADRPRVPPVGRPPSCARIAYSRTAARCRLLIHVTTNLLMAGNNWKPVANGCGKVVEESIV